MLSFEILCVTMHQKDFSKVKEMNIHSDAVFANQADRTSYEEYEFDGHRVKMVTTATRGVGINRNLAITYASADICLFADDDVRYIDDLERVVCGEFEAHPDADVIIFHLDTTDKARKQVSYPQTKKCGAFTRKPWGACRIAVRLSSLKKANVWFTTLFGGGCIFPSGEDSMWIQEAWNKGLTFYVSKETIGTVSFEESTWFTGRDEKYFFARGVYYQAMRPKTAFLWMLYACITVKDHCKLSNSEKMKWMRLGRDGYRRLKPFSEYQMSNGDS